MKISNVSAQQKIVMVSMGSLPKYVFDAFYTHAGSNTLVAFREGANALSSLLETEIPQFRCGLPGPYSSNKSFNLRPKDIWEVGYDYNGRIFCSKSDRKNRWRFRQMVGTSKNEIFVRSFILQIR